MSVATSPVDTFDQGIERFRQFVHDRMPYTFIAYRSLIPAKDDDWYYLAEKTAWFVFVIFNIAKWTARSISVACIVIPFLPLALDAGCAIWQRIKSKHPTLPTISPRLQNAIQSVGFAAFAFLGIFFLFEKGRATT
jgi:hypothetical protein